MSTLPSRANGSAPIDLAHLSRQTEGDRELQTELLTLFARQAERIAADLATARGAAPAARRHRADLLHTLCGSARAIGAWDVAAGAESLEREERREPPPTASAPGLAALDDSIASACRAIQALRRSGSGDER